MTSRSYTTHLLALLLSTCATAAYASDHGSGGGEAQEKPKIEKNVELNKEQQREHMIKSLQSSNIILFEQAVFYFERMGADGILLLVPMLKREDEDSQYYANIIYALGRIGTNPRDRISVSAITPFLNNEDSDLRATSIIALIKIGASSVEALPQINALTSDENTWVRNSAAEAVQKLSRYANKEEKEEKKKQREKEQKLEAAKKQLLEKKKN